MKCLRSFTFLLLFGFMVSCDRGTGYGISGIESPSGIKLYFRREVRGSNFDKLSLSQNPNYCSEPDPKTALIFESIDPHAFYTFVGEELHIYTMSDVSKPPILADGLSIILHKLNNQQFIRMSENYMNLGLKRADVSINSLAWCIS